MATLTITSMQGPHDHAITEGTLTSSDTFTWTQGTRMMLILRNTTGGSLTVNLVGNAATNQDQDGGGRINYSAGRDITIAATTGYSATELDTIRRYLAGGTVTVTGGTNCKYSLLQW